MPNPAPDSPQGTEEKPAAPLIGKVAADADRILLSAFVGSDNLGDESIFMAFVDQLERRLKKPRLTVASLDPAKTRRLLLTRNSHAPANVKVIRRSWLPLAILRHKVCVFGGGGIIQDLSSVFNLIYFLAQIQIAKVAGKTVVLAFVGIGPLNLKISRVFTRIALSDIALCIVRDQDSSRMLKGLGIIGTEVVCASDIALNLNCRPNSRLSDSVDRKYVLLSLRHLYNRTNSVTPASFNSGNVKRGSRLDVFLTKLARELLKFLEANSDTDVIAVPFFGCRDELIHAALRSKLEPRCRQRMRLLRGVVHPCEYLAWAGGARCVIGMRLHSLVLASVRGVPLLALSYAPKVSSFMKQLRLNDQVIDVEVEPDIDQLADRLTAILANSIQIKSRTDRRVRELQNLNRAALARLVHVISSE
ncbi:MAG: polysaccharide pyruvyl transferase family protein [Woeseia sp.]